MSAEPRFIDFPLGLRYLVNGARGHCAPWGVKPDATRRAGAFTGCKFFRPSPTTAALANVAPREDKQ